MKKLLTILLTMLPMLAFAQQVNFKLTPNGDFLSEEGKTYVVVPFEGKNAHQIFQQLCTNVGKIYKNPQKVMSVVDDASITIRAYSSKISYIKDLIQAFDLGGYYNLTFEIKDGRVKVNAPIIDESMTKTINNAHEKDFSRMIHSWAKDGKFKEKFIKQVNYTEDYQNNTINSILFGDNSENEDW